MPPKIAPIISVIIGTYNQKEVLQKVLTSLCHQTVANDLYEIIVVDSLSQDNTPEIIPFFQEKILLKYIRRETSGKAAARNIGIKEAQGDIILLTDADMICDIRFIEEHITFHHKFRNCAAEGLTYNLKELKEDFKQTSNLLPYITKKINANDVLEWFSFLSGNLSIPKRILNAIGLFDEKFTGYGWEDLELGYRLSQKGISLRYLPSAINYHYHPFLNEDIIERKKKMGKSAAIFIKKHPQRYIKYFLGLNPLAMLLYYLIKFMPGLKKTAEKNWKYVWSEYVYREELLKALKIK